MANVLLKPKRIHPFHTESRLIFVPDMSANAAAGSLGRRQFQDGRQRGPRVLGIEIDVPAHERLMRQQGPAQVELTIHPTAKTMFQMLRDDLAEDDLLGEILRADRDRAFPRTADDAG